MTEVLADDYGLSRQAALELIAAPALDYLPQDPRTFRPAIGLVGCGGISAQHLNAYRHAGYDVAALCSRTEDKARARRQQYYPAADVYTDYRQLIERDDIQVIDVATHAAERVTIIEDCLRAGKHVLSQKPFVLDLDDGERLVDLAARCGVTLAVNQNGRWAPHFSYIRRALAANLLGEIVSLNFSVNWDHNWIVGTAFEEMENLVLADFAIHWFDLTQCFFGGREARRVYAANVRAAAQTAKPPLLASTVIEYENGLATLAFNADVRAGQNDRTYVAGTKGTVVSDGPSLSEQTITFYAGDTYAQPQLRGTWFREGFHGAMAELLRAIEEGREPENSARLNLRSLALCFAAIASARDGVARPPGDARRLPNSSTQQ